MSDDPREERQLRIDQMTINIEKMRFDMLQSEKDREQSQKWETRKFAVSLLLATAVAVGAGVGIGNLIWAHNPPQSPVPIVIQLPAPPTK